MNRKNHDKYKSNMNGKIFFFSALIFFIIWFTFTYFIEGHDLKKCTGNDFKNCGCPVDTSYIANKHVLLIDVTDPVPDGKREDLKQLIYFFGSQNEKFTSWISKDRKSDLLTVALVGAKSPSDTIPLASLCKLPPKISMFMLGDLDSNLREAFEILTTHSISKIYEDQKKTESRIVETIAVFTSSSASWSKSSALILASDLRENSTQCGLFENSEVIVTERLSTSCKQFFDNLKSNMYADNSSRPSRTFICRFDTKDPKVGLKKYWDDIFYNSTGVNPIYTCNISDAIRILNEPFSSLKNEKNKK